MLVRLRSCLILMLIAAPVDAPAAATHSHSGTDTLSLDFSFDITAAVIHLLFCFVGIYTEIILAKNVTKQSFSTKY